MPSTPKSNVIIIRERWNGVPAAIMSFLEDAFQLLSVTALLAVSLYFDSFVMELVALLWFVLFTFAKTGLVRESYNYIIDKEDMPRFVELLSEVKASRTRLFNVQPATPEKQEREPETTHL